MESSTSYFKNPNHKDDRSGDTETALEVKNLKYLTEEKINGVKVGYEANSYLIETVLRNKFDSFSFLLSEKYEKGGQLLNKNVNGWGPIHFIVKLKRYSNLLI